MKLHQALQQHRSMSAENKFAYAVLKRLSIIETCTAIGMDLTSALKPSVHDECRVQQKTAQQTQLIIAINQHTDEIAGLIKDACLQQWQDETPAKLKKIGQESATAVLSKFKYHQLKDKIVEYISKHSRKMIAHLGDAGCMEQVAIIQQIIIQCWPNIDTVAVEHALFDMASCINRLHEVPAATEAEDEWIQVPASQMGIFKPESPTIVESISNTCSIC